MKKFILTALGLMLSCFMFLAHAETSSVVFDESASTSSGVTSLGYGWNSWSWGINTPTTIALTPGSTPTGFKGVKALDISFTTAWGGFSPGSTATFNTAGYKEIVFAVYNVSEGDSLYFQAGAGGATGATLYLPTYSPSNSIPVGQWTWIRIPISHFNLGPNPAISWIAVESSKVGHIYLDEIRFEANTTLYEGVAGQKGPGTQMFYWGGPAPVVAGTPDNYWIEFNATNSWGGIQLQEIFSGYTMQSSSYTHLTVHFQKSNSTQTVSARLISDTNAVLGSVDLESYVPGHIATPGVWYRAIIPITDIVVGVVNLSGLVIDSNIPASFKFDDVRLLDMTYLQIMRFPIQTANYPQGAYTPSKINSVLDHHMSTVYSDKDGTILSFTGELFQYTSSYPKGGTAACYPKLGGALWSSFLTLLYNGTSGCYSNQALNYEAHPGYDYVAVVGVPVKVVASGIVVNNTVFTPGQDNTLCVPKGMTGIKYQGCAEWGAVGVDHGNGYISQYLHLSTISVTPGQVVVEGQQIGLSGDIGVTGHQHLHFEVLKLRDGASNDYQLGNYATVDPYGFDTSQGVADYMIQYNLNHPNVCLWSGGCRY